MPDEKNLENETPKEEIVYATPMKRVWAWVGVVYMVILVLLMTYGLASGGYLNGIGPLMLSPALAGVGASAIVRYRSGEGRGGLAVCILVAGAGFVLAVLNVVRSIPAIVSQVGAIG
ncbi:hypothetical protein AAEU42_11595 [Pseudoflavonifractor phocaeensis]|uniref:hypothetical protein n=1 Tax=Pseudoflavonifractor phocaeensis TaxID=1870988 RepID=UPI00313CC842